MKKVFLIPFTVGLYIIDGVTGIMLRCLESISAFFEDAVDLAVKWKNKE
jgi:hypothetical protein